jgi:hypothetical protein
MGGAATREVEGAQQLISGGLTWTVTTGTPEGFSGGSYTLIVPGLPAGSVSGDLLVALICYDASRTITPPSGWTAIGTAIEDGDSYSKLQLFYASGGTSPSTTWTMSGTYPDMGWGQIVNVHPSTGVAAVDTEGNGSASGTSSATATGPALTTTLASDLLISALVNYNYTIATTVTVPAGYTSIAAETPEGSSWTNIGWAHATSGAAGAQTAPVWGLSPTPYYGSQVTSVAVKN